MQGWLSKTSKKLLFLEKSGWFLKSFASKQFVQCWSGRMNYKEDGARRGYEPEVYSQIFEREEAEKKARWEKDFLKFFLLIIFSEKKIFQVKKFWRSKRMGSSIKFWRCGRKNDRRRDWGKIMKSNKSRSLFPFHQISLRISSPLNHFYFISNSIRHPFNSSLFQLYSNCVT